MGGPIVRQVSNDGAKSFDDLATIREAKLPAVALGLEDLAALDAGGADAHLAGAALDLCPNGTQIDIPPTARHVVRMRDVVTELRTFLADCTNLRHGNAPT